MNSDRDICRICIMNGTFCFKREEKILPILFYGEEDYLIDESEKKAVLSDIEVDQEKCPYFLEQLIKYDKKENK